VNLSYKYNTNVEFNDYSGSITLTVFDSVAEKLFGVSANQFKEIENVKETFEAFLDSLRYQMFEIGIEIKTDRFILRTVERLSDERIIEVSR
jgi:hypothetical protein